ncbi:hypothetical protein LA6_000559 [Marinibacterium anthonyi]|nr:hypothetical protein LA6_000559 [Marinibacterium anthonyi]
MTPETLQSLAAVFGWMTLLNIAFYAFSALLVVALRILA